MLLVLIISTIAYLDRSFHIYALCSPERGRPFYRPMVLAGDFKFAFAATLCAEECSRFIPEGLEVEIYQVTECSINTIGSP